MKFKALLAKLQYLLPQHCLSRFIGFLCHCEHPRWLKNFAIKRFVNTYQVDLSEAEYTTINDYKHFNAFFTRALKPASRSLPTDKNVFISPIDGCISQIGSLQHESLIQAKGRYYCLTTLLGGDTNLANIFQDGCFATLYLSPRDYHRVHMPYAGHLTMMRYIPGNLFAVNPTSVQHIDQLFARNERIVCHFETALGPMLVILVGALIVGSIETVWAGTITPTKKRHIQTWHYKNERTYYLDRGAELGRFKLGSTVILLFPANTVNWHSNLQPTAVLKCGDTLAYNANL